MYRRLTGIGVVFALACAARAGGPPAGNWPQFRGPHADGRADVRSLPLEWSADKNLAWKVAVPGYSWSSPVVWGDRLFLTVSVEESRDELYRWEVHCRDCGSGELLWKREAARGAPPVPIHLNNSYATETPVTDGRRLYAYFGMKGLYCYDLDGELLWEKHFGAFRTLDDMGPGSSPALADGRLFVLCDNVEKAFLAALDAETGKELWRVDRPSKSSWSTPYLWRNSRRAELVAAGTDAVQSFDPATGELLWEVGFQGRVTATPVAAGDLLVVGGSGKSQGGSLFAVRAGAAGKLSLPRGGGAAEGIAWHRPRSGPGFSSPVVAAGRLYVFGKGVVHCYRAATGEEVYSERLPDAGNFLASPWSAAGRVYGLDESGQTFVLPAAGGFELLAVNWLQGTFWASPAVTDGAVYLRSGENLYCVRERAGR